MSKTLSLTDKDLAFIEAQQLFFVGTAPDQGRINISPKGLDSFRVINPNRVVWLNLTGSGNETQAHVDENGRMTILFCSFNGSPNILRIYGKAYSIFPESKEWDHYINLFETHSGSRQVFVLDVELVQNSCGFGIPKYQFEEQRDTLEVWAQKKGTKGIENYWTEKNQLTIDNKPVRIPNTTKATPDKK